MLPSIEHFTKHRPLPTLQLNQLSCQGWHVEQSSGSDMTCSPLTTFPWPGFSHWYIHLYLYLYIYIKTYVQKKELHIAHTNAQSFILNTSEPFETPKLCTARDLSLRPGRNPILQQDWDLDPYLKRTRKKLVVILSPICFRNKISQHIPPSTVLILVTISSNFWLQNDPRLSSWRPRGLLIDAYQINLAHPGGISRQAITKFSDFLACSEKCCTALSIERKKGTSRISRDALRVTGTAPVFNRIDPRKKDEPDEPFKSRQFKACLPGGQEFFVTQFLALQFASLCYQKPLLSCLAMLDNFCCNHNEDAFPRKCP